MPNVYIVPPSDCWDQDETPSSRYLICSQIMCMFIHGTTYTDHVRMQRVYKIKIIRKNIIYIIIVKTK